MAVAVPACHMSSEPGHAQRVQKFRSPWRVVRILHECSRRQGNVTAAPDTGTQRLSWNARLYSELETHTMPL